MSTSYFAAIAPDNLAVVTGATGGIGLAAAPAFADKGHAHRPGLPDTRAG